MPNIITVLSNIGKPYQTPILIVIVIIIFSLVGYYAYSKYGAVLIEKKPYDDIANANRRSDTVEIMFFSADWCPHCKTAKPEWNKFVNKFNSTIINGYTVNCVEVNCTDPDNVEIQASIKQFKVEHYPTLKMIKKGDVIDFDAKISEESLEKFVNAMTV